MQTHGCWLEDGKEWLKRGESHTQETMNYSRFVVPAALFKNPCQTKVKLNKYMS
jgi:hypothetical protein